MRARAVVRLLGRILAYLIVACACALAIAFASGSRLGFASPWGYRALLVVVAIVALEPRLRRRPERRHLWLEMFVLLVLPWWGAALNRQALTDSSCEPPDNHLLAVRELAGVFGGYAVALAAYVAARLKPRGYAAVAEAPVQGVLLFGFALVGMLAVHTVAWIPVGVAFFGLGLPVLAPSLIAVLFAVALWRRPRRSAGGRPLAFASVPLGAVFAATYGVAHAVWLKNTWGVFNVVTQTTRGVFSQLPIPQVDCDGHYLCTVAAQGSPWLVRPLRMGRRRGLPIVVNRQLAVANAFEDLLHERWPRSGRALRRAYDRLALPISRWLRIKPLANLTYLLMKPAEWIFLATLKAFDDEPEARIGRMYR